MSDIKFNEAIDKLCDEYYPDFPSCEFHNLIDTLKFEHEALRKSHAELKEAYKDLTCILERKRKNNEVETVICGQGIVEKYLRQGYQFSWEETDRAREQALSNAEKLNEVMK